MMKTNSIPVITGIVSSIAVFFAVSHLVAPIGPVIDTKWRGHDTHSIKIAPVEPQPECVPQYHQNCTDELCLRLKLVGVRFDDPAEAFIKDTVSGIQGAYKMGSYVLGAKIIKIERCMVTIEKDTHKTTLLLAEGREGPVTEVSPNEMIISKSGVFRDMEDAELASENKVSALSDCAYETFPGVKISGIKKGGLAELAGLRNGDVIKVVNDQRLASPQRAIQVFRKIRKQSGTVDVILFRKDELVKMSYRLRN